MQFHGHKKLLNALANYFHGDCSSFFDYDSIFSMQYHDQHKICMDDCSVESKISIPNELDCKLVPTYKNISTFEYSHADSLMSKNNLVGKKLTAESIFIKNLLDNDNGNKNVI